MWRTLALMGSLTAVMLMLPLVGRSRCWLGRHDEVILKQKRDQSGWLVKPHGLVWECQRCGREIGESVMWINQRLLMELRGQPARKGRPDDKEVARVH